MSSDETVFLRLSAGSYEPRTRHAAFTLYTRAGMLVEPERFRVPFPATHAALGWPVVAQLGGSP